MGREAGVARRGVRLVAGEPLGTEAEVSDAEKARTMLGWEPVVKLEAGLRRTLRWVREEEVRAS